MRVLINFAMNGYYQSQKELSKSAIEVGGFDKVIEYSGDDLDSDFREKYKEHFIHSRGAGYWIWKPYIILKTLLTLEPEDILMYCDSGASFISSIDPYMDIFIGSIMLFQMDIHLERHWTKSDIFEKLDCLNDIDVTDSRQCLSGFIFCKKDENAITILKKWFELCEDFHLVSDEPSILPNFPGFRENRHDQSLLSCLAHKYKDIHKIQIEADPSQYGRPIHKLPEIIDCHRRR